MSNRRHHLTHLGVLEAESDGRSLSQVTGWRGDPDVRPLIHNVASSQHHATRVRRPAVRRGYLEHGPGGAARGDEPFVEVDWSEALDLVAAELRRVYATHGSSGVYGRSYGWASAGRFHHGPSQVHRFLSCLGGYVSAVGDYSYGTSGLLLPHVLGAVPDLMRCATTWDVVRDHTELMVCFGGLSEKNTAVGPGGIAQHSTRDAVRQARAAGCAFVDITPIRDDTFAEAEATWIAPRPGSDAALLLALAHTLDAEGLVDQEFLATHTVGYDDFIAYVRGDTDGVAKSADWAAPITEVPAATIVALARRMSGARTMITMSWSMQRQDHGEQPIWLGVTLAAMLGQIGLPGGGFQHGYGTISHVGLPDRAFGVPTVPGIANPETAYIPVARIADMLLHPGSTVPLNGSDVQLPHIDLIYWVGGNPFHHQQDLSRLRRGWKRPSTVIVHEQFWTSTARHADIVLPATMTIERDDFGAGRNDLTFFPMPALTEPCGEARDDYAIFADLAERLGVADTFTEGRDAHQWLRHLYDEWQADLRTRGHDLPDFDAFWTSDPIEIPRTAGHQVLHAAFRADPHEHPLPTRSGRIEISSPTIASYGYDDCPGHPVWLEPREWSDAGLPLHLIANQPGSRLHSQLDVGATSRASKVQGREPVRMHPSDASTRGLSDGDVVRIRSRRGSCLAGLVISGALRPGVVQLSAGAWYDPDPADPTFCRHGAANVLTADRVTSSLSQGTTAGHVMVEVERFEGPVPELAVDKAPPFVADPRSAAS